MNTSGKFRRKRYLSPALTIVILFGLISMLGDLVHESARSVNGQYLSLVGLTATQVGLVFGIGEFLGYALRLLFGSLLDRSGRYWLFLFIGFGYSTYGGYHGLGLVVYIYSA